MSHYTPLKLPYFALSSSLPGPLPTFAEIISFSRSETHNLNFDPTTQSSPEHGTCHPPSRQIVRIPGSAKGDFLVKWGPDVRLLEAENMLFVSANSRGRVRVPKLYAAYQRWYDAEAADHDNHNPEEEEETEGKGRLHTILIMQFIPGTPIAALLSNRSRRFRRHRHAVAADLAAQFAALRRLPQERSPSRSPYFGALGHRPFPNRFWRGAGPFRSVEAYTDALFRLECPAAHATEQQRVRDAVRARWGRVVRQRERAWIAERREGHAVAWGVVREGEHGVPVFTHADLHANNVVVRWRPFRSASKGGEGKGGKEKEKGEEEGEDEDENELGIYEAYIIDWESAGWHAPFWEHVSGHSPGAGPSKKDPWFRLMRRVLKPYREEEKMLEYVRDICIPDEEYYH
ncbi:hypothetical protein F4810DRAFT_724492 [Camillea tinctor]|nr:hypothetical protein F4810DRAFT_724492 [Camillea tinctor]